ncbi:hypothetical protein I6F07_21125 [Ensifer sp. IC4062]|nr:hypothetical protein [Ensifer sp. IC4062]MCA1442677.1 hypothetical protein [Ensifer sp. IC4062]
MKPSPIAVLFVLFGLNPAHALTEADLVDRYCAGMIKEFYNPDGTRTDCISATHAIEVEFSNKWAEAIGQALHYALWTTEFGKNSEAFPRWHYQVRTPRKPGIIFACTEDRRLEMCANHVVRAKRIAEEYRIPLTIWDCNPDEDMTLGDCLRLDYPEEAYP